MIVGLEYFGTTTRTRLGHDLAWELEIAHGIIVEAFYACIRSVWCSHMSGYAFVLFCCCVLFAQFRHGDCHQNLCRTQLCTAVKVLHWSPAACTHSFQRSCKSGHVSSTDAAFVCLNIDTWDTQRRPGPTPVHACNFQRSDL